MDVQALLVFIYYNKTIDPLGIDFKSQKYLALSKNRKDLNVSDSKECKGKILIKKLGSSKINSKAFIAIPNNYISLDYKM